MTLDLNRYTGRNQKTKLYSVWTNMRARCSCKTNASYSYYGGRGITVCDKWQDFDVFRKWAIGHSYSPKLTIDRINNNGNYEPENCRWVTRKIQALNSRQAKFIKCGGQARTVTDWSQLLGVHSSTMSWRLANWSIDRALSTFNTRGVRMVLE